jgi:cell division protein ZipA
MEVVSLIIMALGLVALVGIFIISRIARRDLPQRRDGSIPVLRDAGGNETSSVLDDLPARDGKRPADSARAMTDAMVSDMQGKPATAASGENSGAAKAVPVLPPQLVLFVAADIEEGFAGEEVLKALENAGLQFGEMDIFHRVVLTASGEASLFSVANGVKPWTLVPDELVQQATPGLSMILNLPSPIDNHEAIHDFVRTAERLNGDLGGVLKNQQQETVTPEYREQLLALAA